MSAFEIPEVGTIHKGTSTAKGATWNGDLMVDESWFLNGKRTG
jgi:hypothetical protein